jgi:hypothetical protein
MPIERQGEIDVFTFSRLCWLYYTETMDEFYRREFVATLGFSAAAVPVWTCAAAVAPSPAAAARLWIDPQLAALPTRPWRQIHQDFHNTQHIGKIGAKFNADEYGARLLAANVDAIVVFAKDQHEFFHYPSR